MKEPQLKLRFLLDEGVPTAVAETFRRHGHEAILLKDVIALGSSDELVWKAALVNEAILIAFDKDVKALGRRSDQDDRFKRVNVISFRKLREPAAAKRLEGAMSYIEHEWRFCSQKTARTLIIEIYPHQLRTLR